MLGSLQSKRAHLQGASSFLVSRVANAILVLAQLALVARLYNSLDASQFFVLWTVFWAASVGVRFGFDLLLPKHAAAAELAGSTAALAGYRRVATYSVPLVALLSGPILIVVIPDASPGAALVAVPVVLVGAIGWAAAYLASALARGYGHAGLSGWIGGPASILLATAAVPVAHAISGSWLVLGAFSAVALALAGALALALLARAIGWDRVGAALLDRPTRLDPDTRSTGALTAIAELNLVLPVWIAGALGLDAVEVGALYGALRMAAAFSWLFTAVVTVITPMLAEALARREYRRLRGLLWRSALLGVGTTLPLAVVGALFSGQLLGLLDPAYEDYGYLLAIMIAARLLDATAGAVGEALILGDHARWELGNQALSAAFLLATAAALEPALGVAALASAAALAVVVANLTRVVEVRWLLANTWKVQPPQ